MPRLAALVLCPWALIIPSLLLAQQPASAPSPSSLVIPDAAPPLSKTDADRLYNIGIGYYKIKPAPEDADLVLRAFAQSDNEKVHQHACLAVEKMSASKTKLFNDTQVAALLPSITAALRAPEDDTREFAARALRNLAPRLTPDQFADACKQSNQLLAAKDPEDRRRGAGLAQGLFPRMSPAQLDDALHTLFTALDLPLPPKPQDPAVDSPEHRAHDMQLRAVGVAANSLRDPKLAPALADRLMSPDHLYPHARLYPLLPADTRQKILTLILDHLNDDTLIYSTTSGIRTPFHHSAADALLLLIPDLAPEDRQKTRDRAAEARASFEKAGAEKSDLDNIFPPLLTALDKPAK